MPKMSNKINSRKIINSSRKRVKSWLDRRMSWVRVRKVEDLKLKWYSSKKKVKQLIKRASNKQISLNLNWKAKVKDNRLFPPQQLDLIKHLSKSRVENNRLLYQSKMVSSCWPHQKRVSNSKRKRNLCKRLQWCRMWRAPPTSWLNSSRISSCSNLKWKRRPTNNNNCKDSRSPNNIPPGNCREWPLSLNYRLRKDSSKHSRISNRLLPRPRLTPAPLMTRCRPKTSTPRRRHWWNCGKWWTRTRLRP